MHLGVHERDGQAAGGVTFGFDDKGDFGRGVGGLGDARERKRQRHGCGGRCVAVDGDGGGDAVGFFHAEVDDGGLDGVGAGCAGAIDDRARRF